MVPKNNHNRIDVLYIDCINKESLLEKISAELDKLEKNKINNAPWRSFPYKPEVWFSIAYNDCIFIKYYVKENAIRARYNQTNDPVYKDSCVKFFISFNGERQYYNMEFNCVGTCLMSYRTNREDKNMLSERDISKIKRLSFIKSSSNGNAEWELTILIPLEAFVYHKLHSLKNQTCRANFYKCGDDLPQPHYLAWNNIESPAPDFHLPGFFGEIHFI